MTPRSISTAPEDGTEILAFKKNIGWVIVRWLGDEHPDCDCIGFHESWNHSIVEDLTHWLPLPEAPK